jgi:hypothetical protein
LVEPQNPDWMLGRKRQDPGAPRSLDAGVDFPLVARVIFVCFFELFSLDFHARLVPSI